MVGWLFLFRYNHYMKYTVLIVAAGAGTRMGLGYNKAYYRMADHKTILEHTMELFVADTDCEELVIVTDSDLYRQEISREGVGKIVLVQGGSSRQQSVWHGLQAVISPVVLVHDGARPFLSRENLEALKQVMETEEAACLMVPCKDTIKIVREGRIQETLPRAELMAAQTPQAFRTDLLFSCMKQAFAEGFDGTDDCSLVERYSDVKILAAEGSYANRKITTPEDL